MPTSTPSQPARAVPSPQLPAIQTLRISDKVQKMAHKADIGRTVAPKKAKQITQTKNTTPMVTSSIMSRSTSRPRKLSASSSVQGSSPRKSRPISRELPTMDPSKIVQKVKFEELDSIDVDSDGTNDGTVCAPFYVVVSCFDTSKQDQAVPDMQPFEMWFGPYRCIQEANDAAVILAVDNYRNIHMQYYNELEVQPELRICPVDSDGTGLILVEPKDPRRRFFLCAKATDLEPNERVQEHTITKQGWDIFLATLVVTGIYGSKLIEPISPIIKHKISISRNNANKYAVKMFLDAVRKVVPNNKTKAFLDELSKYISEYKTKMKDAAGKSYEWSFEKSFTMTDKVKNAQGDVDFVKTFIRVSVEQFDTDP